MRTYGMVEWDLKNALEEIEELKALLKCYTDKFGMQPFRMKVKTEAPNASAADSEKLDGGEAPCSGAALPMKWLRAS